MQYTEADLINPNAVTLEGLVNTFIDAQSAINIGRKQLLPPNANKQGPYFGFSDLAQVFQVDGERLRKRYNYATKINALPSGWLRTPDGQLVPNTGKGKVLFTPTEISKIVAALFPECTRGPGVHGVVISICNFKGGVTKSTTAQTTAQGLSLKGMRVLVIDLDPQGTTTKWMADRRIEPKDCCVDLFNNDIKGTLSKYIIPTYWPGIDLVPAHDYLQGAELYFSKSLQEKDEAKLRESLMHFPNEVRKLRAEYDVIIIDTPPSLNNLTLAAMFCSDGLLMPLPPSNPDIESAAHFWKLYIDTCKAQRVPLDAELFKFVRVQITKSDKTKVATQNMIEWIRKSYGGKVMNTIIPNSAAVGRAAEAFGTVFDDSQVQDISRSQKAARDQMRALYSQTADEIATLIYGCWRREAAQIALASK